MSRAHDSFTQARTDAMALFQPGLFSAALDILDQERASLRSTGQRLII
jgi:hypothetical protein